MNFWDLVLFPWHHWTVTVPVCVIVGIGCALCWRELLGLLGGQEITEDAGSSMIILGIISMAMAAAFATLWLPLVVFGLLYLTWRWWPTPVSEIDQVLPSR